MYAPKGKMGLTLKFASHEGHFGTMQMSGGMSRSEDLEECRRFWIQERQSVPGFLAQVTTEMFEKTTVSVVPDSARDENWRYWYGAGQGVRGDMLDPLESEGSDLKEDQERGHAKPSLVTSAGSC